MAETDGITQLLIGARKLTEQALGLARVTCDTVGVLEAETARAALSDASDARVLMVLHEETRA